MPPMKKWMLFTYNSRLNQDFSITPTIFKESLLDSLYYAFLSLPFTNANISVGTDRYGMSLERRIENIVKGLLVEKVIIKMLGKEAKITKEHYLTEFPEKTSYWEKDNCDAVRKTMVNDEIVAQVDVKAINIDWSHKTPPTMNQLNETKLERTDRAPETREKVKRPLVMLLEAPWRHFHKLKTQYKTYRMKVPVQYPHENLVVLAPKFSLPLKDNRELLMLYREYYQNWENTQNKREDFVTIKSKIPKKLSEFIVEEERYPESIDWLISHWDEIKSCLEKITEELSEYLVGYWIWLFGVVDHYSAKHFIKVYQNDKISYDGKTLWSSATRSPHEKKWTNYKKGRRKSKPRIAGDDHPDLYWNNNTIDISSEWVYPVEERF
ncbi:MAG: hypothetical protein GF308_19520 [Candidatus Heimdallarchaeota archaeon]|nr:hypothetical protein [Candidatus Heimdallarchaeota archaeon]